MLRVDLLISPLKYTGEISMKLMRVVVFALLPMAAGAASAGDLTTDAAIGGAIGGALGGAVGAQAGGRNGAILGAGVGGAAGAAISTQGDRDPRRSQQYEERRHYDDRRYDDDDHHHRHGSHFCPPGQAKKGRC